MMNSISRIQATSAASQVILIAMLTVDGQEYLVMPYPVLQFFLFPTRFFCSDCSRICYVAFSVDLRFNQQWRSQDLDIGGTAGLGDRSPPAGSSQGQSP